MRRVGLKATKSKLIVDQHKVVKKSGKRRKSPSQKGRIIETSRDGYWRNRGVTQAWKKQNRIRVGAYNSR